MALTIDASRLGDRFVVLAICVVYRGNAIPGAWTLLPAGQKGAWRGTWLHMLRQLKPAIPRDWTVVVLADCGLYARWLFRRIVRLGWHPFLRINKGSTFRPAGHARFVGVYDLVGRSGCAGVGRPLPQRIVGWRARSWPGGVTGMPSRGSC